MTEPSKHLMHFPGVSEAVELKPGQRFCYYIPVDGYIEDQGYRVAIVIENEPGYVLTGTWPYHGEPGEVLPLFWGHDYQEACAIAKDINQKNGLSEKEADLIVASSMAAQFSK